MAASYEGGAMFATPGCGMGGYGVTYGCILQLKHTQVVSRCSDCVTIQFNTYPGMGGWAAGIGMGIWTVVLLSHNEERGDRERDIIITWWQILQGYLPSRLCGIWCCIDSRLISMGWNLCHSWLTHACVRYRCDRNGCCKYRKIRKNQNKFHCEIRNQQISNVCPMTNQIYQLPLLHVSYSRDFVLLLLDAWDAPPSIR